MGEQEIRRLKENDSVSRALSGALHSGEHGLNVVPGLVLRCVSENCWQQRILERTGELVCFERFEDFVTTPPIKGLGATLRLLDNICRDEPKAQDAIDRVTQREPSKHHAVDNIHSIDRPNGTSRAAALRRLRKNRPDLHAKVMDKEMTANAAMIEAGFRKVPTQLELLRRDWKKASKEERDAFMDEVNEEGW